MAPVVPEPECFCGEEPLAAALGEALEAALACTGATAGWVGVTRAEGGLHFPARRGSFPEAWLALQQGGAAWGFEVRDGPTLFNVLPAWPVLGEPPLRNLLTCPLPGDDAPKGNVVLANKAAGFTSQDSTVLQGIAHLVRKRLARLGSSRVTVPSLLRHAFDRMEQGVVITDERGTLVFANAAWARWTGFPAAELAGRAPPFPFWVGHRDLASAAAAPPATLPFRRRDGSVFPCDMEVLGGAVGGCRITVAFLRPAPAPPGDALVLLLTARGVALWDARWQALTGLTAGDVDGAAADVVLDWLFPRQRQREWVADLVQQPTRGKSRRGARTALDVLTPDGGRALPCWFLPVVVDGGDGWLLIVGGFGEEGTFAEESPREGQAADPALPS